MSHSDAITRVSLKRITPDVSAAMGALHGSAASAAREAKIEPELLELLRIRASQINGCAFCLDMHSKDLRAHGETEQRLYMISAWREATHLYDARERAALAWAEAVTRLVEQEVPDAIYEEARGQFSETELAQLTLAVVAINGWNRLNIAFRTPAGNYKSPAKRSAA